MRIVADNWENNSNKIKELENSKDLEHNYLKPSSVSADIIARGIGRH